MTPDAIADVITAITRAAGLEDHVTSHVLRHTFGSELERRIDDALIQPAAADTPPASP